MRRPLGTVSRRIALTNAFSDLLMTFFETHVFATDGAWGSRTGSTSLFFALEQISQARPSKNGASQLSLPASSTMGEAFH